MIERAQGSHLIDSEGKRYIDGVSSLWCNVHGHRHAGIDAAVSDQLGKVAHTTMLGLSHPAAAELAARLVDLAPPGLSRVFYSESGSTATEIALKMAFQYQQQRGGQHARRTSFVHLRDSYHGDTIGSVSVGGIDLFHSTYRPLLFQTHAAEPGDAADLERVLAVHEEEIAAVIVEPLVQGAAGMLTHPPGYLRAVRELCDRFGVLLICDEVATGFGRTGKMFACEHEDVAPDLLCLAKGLTGGYLPLAATLATERIYEGFLGAPEEYRTFFHGHTYTGNPLACAAALASLDAFEQERTIDNLQPKIDLLWELLTEVEAMPEVTEVRGRGVMIGIDLGEHDPALRLGHQVTLEARKRGAIIRPLSDVIVLMPPLSISEDELRQLIRITVESIEATCSSLGATPVRLAQVA
jgi:adenosylmethionine-8-amino-7-oxononanoate aminotransferase